MKIEEIDGGKDECSLNVEDVDEEEREKKVVEVVDAKRVLVLAGARILFYPTLLYNVFRNKIQSEFRWWDEIDPFLLLGAVPFPKDVPRLKQLGVGGVITLNEPYETLVPSSLYHDYGIDHLVIPTRDYLFAPSFVDISRGVDFIHRNVSSGRTTYVHCKAGRGRSTTVVLCYLVAYKNMTPDAALEYVRLRRPRVLLHPSQWKAVREYKDRLLVTSTPTAGTSPATAAANSTCAIVVAAAATSTTTLSPSNDAVWITKADLEGYHGYCAANSSKDLAVVPKAPRNRPMIAMLSCLFASLKASGSCGAVTRQLSEARAC
ncbi:Dual specificity phosphatase, catalytic domain [Dillenia turbinata]|uniref:phosphatidylglycerophosphatase n=1 Tax=Dillenia turbinata TaxID=194707 RepID=A0AAN8W911_9MAGN